MQTSNTLEKANDVPLIMTNQHLLLEKLLFLNISLALNDNTPNDTELISLELTQTWRDFIHKIPGTGCSRHD